MSYTCEFCLGKVDTVAKFITHLEVVETMRNKDKRPEIHQLVAEIKKSPEKFKGRVITKAAEQNKDLTIPKPVQANKPEPTAKQPPANKPIETPPKTTQTQVKSTVQTPTKPATQVVAKPTQANSMYGPPLTDNDIKFELPDVFPENGILVDPTHDKVRLLVCEDWLPYLEWKFGGRPESYRSVSSCLYRKVEGDMTLIDKVYLEGRPPEFYPFRCDNMKTLEFSFRGANQRWTSNTRRMYTLLRSNIQDTYIRYQNQGLADHMRRNANQGGYDPVLSGHDYYYWQMHISDSYTKPAYQKLFLKNLADLLIERANEYRENHGSGSRGEPRGSDMYLPKEFKK